MDMAQEFVKMIVISSLVHISNSLRVLTNVPVQLSKLLVSFLQPVLVTIFSLFQLLQLHNFYKQYQTSMFSLQKIFLERY
jgi:hypothetical protein